MARGSVTGGHGAQLPIARTPEGVSFLIVRYVYPMKGHV